MKAFTISLRSGWLAMLLFGLVPAISQAAPNVVGWGINTSGQNAVPALLTNAIELAEGSDFCLALKSDSTVIAWGSHWNGYRYVPWTVPAGLTNVAAIAAGYDFSLALKTDGTVFAWGANGLRQASVPPALKDVVAIAAGYGHSLALRSDGSVVAWGYDTSGNTIVPAGLKNVVAIAAGFFHSLALRSDGTVVAWGSDCELGAVTVPAGLKNVVAISGGCAHSLALKADGTVVAWGQNFAGQLNVPPRLGNVVAIAAGETYNLALTSNGTVVGWGANGAGQATPPLHLTNVVVVAAGWEHSLAVVGPVCDFAVSPTKLEFDYQGGKTNINVVASSSKCPWTVENTNNWIDIESGTSAVGNGQIECLVNANRLAESRTGNLTVEGHVVMFEQAGVPPELLPRIERQPEGKTFEEAGGTFVMRVRIEEGHHGAIGPITYQWYFNDTAISGATNPELVLKQIQPSNAGDYYVVISGAFGDVTSATATIRFSSDSKGESESP